jgi:hypothetical protein
MSLHIKQNKEPQLKKPVFLVDGKLDDKLDELLDNKLNEYNDIPNNINEQSNNATNDWKSKIIFGSYVFWKNFQIVGNI